MPGKRRVTLLLCLFCSAMLCAMLLVFVCSAFAGRTVRVGWPQLPGYQETDASGKPFGYNYEYLKTIARYTGWQYEFVTEYNGQPVDWGVCFALLERDELDLMGSIFKTNERAQKYAYPSVASAETFTSLFVLKDSALAYGDFAAFDGITVASDLSGLNSEQLTDYSRICGFTVKRFIDCATYAEQLAALESGLADAGVIDGYTPDEYTRPVADFAPREVFFIAKKNDHALLDELNRALIAIKTEKPFFESELAQKYGRTHSARSSFTKAEKELILNDNVVRTAVCGSWYPLCDEQGSGVAGGVLGMLAQETGLEFQFVQAPTLKAASEMVKRGEAELVACGESDFTEAEKYGFVLSSCYLELPLVMVQNDRITDSPRTCIPEGLYLREHDESSFTLPDAAACFEAVHTGKAERTLADSYTANFYLNKFKYQHLKLAALQGEKLRLSMAAAEDGKRSDLLIGIIDKGIARLDPAQVNSYIVSSAMITERGTAFEYFINTPGMLAIAMLLFTALMIAVVIYIAIGKRHLYIKSKTDELAGFLRYVCRANDEASEVDLDLGLVSRYYVDEKGFTKKTQTLDWRKDALEKTHPDDRAVLTAHISDEALSSGSGYGDYFVCRMLAGDGKYIWYSSVMQQIGGGRRFMFFRHDINAIRTEDERKAFLLQSAAAAAEKAGRAKSEFLSRMSHELRTPLNAVTGYIRLAAEPGCTRQKQADCLKKAQLAANRLLETINEVLDMSSIESGKLRLSGEPFSLSDVLEQNIAMFSSIAAQKGVRFSSDTSGVAQTAFKGDTRRLSRLIMNLLSNAVKFTPEGGGVRLTAGTAPVSGGRHRISLTVSDTGVGMSQEFMEHLFEPFEQQDGVAGGTGLGLSITKNLAELMDGSVRAKSEQGKGSTFYAEVCLTGIKAAEKSGKAESEALPDIAPLEGKRVLLAEDNIMNREIACEILSGLGLKTDSAEDGKQALELFEKSGKGYYSAVLLDVRMPVMDGLTAARRLRGGRHPDAKTIPVFAMTANAFSDDVTRSLSAGMDEHITKPIDVIALSRLLIKYIKEEKNGIA